MSLIGYWYATGPKGKPYYEGSPDWNLHRVIACPQDTPSVVLVQNAGGNQFWVPTELVQEIAAPPISPALSGAGEG